MRIGFLADIHANLPALRRVLVDMRRRGIDGAWSAGDLVGFGPFPNEVIELLDRHAIASVRGNQETEALAARRRRSPHPRRHIEWTASVLTPANRRRLRALPDCLEFECDGARVLLVHGTPRHPLEAILPSMTRESLAAWFPGDAPRPDVLVGGHTHVPFARRIDGMLVANAGSVGRPFDGDRRAAWVEVRIENGVGRGTVHRIPYPVEETLAAMKAIGLKKPHRRSLRHATHHWPPR